MKTLALLPSLVASVVALAVEPKLSYDGHKVFRVPVLDDGSHIKGVINKLNVITWQPPTRKGAFADVQVAPSQLDAFHKAMNGQEIITMHEDLGKSITEEGTFHTYAGTLTSLRESETVSLREAFMSSFLPHGAC